MIKNESFRNPGLAKKLIQAIHCETKHKWHIMEVCGGQTHAIAKYDIENLLPPNITLIHGPGCPVCVTPVSHIDMAIKLALRENVILVTFGDMMRVPGSETDLLTAKARGADVRMVYSPLDSLRIAYENPEKEVIFFAIGFETTTPVHALTLKYAIKNGVGNFSILPSLFTVPAAIKSLVADPETRIDGFLAAGHVCAVTGYNLYKEISETLRIPIVVTGFEPIDLLYGIYLCIKQLEQGNAFVENGYSRMVQPEGNIGARTDIDQFFEPADQEWRGLGLLKKSGYKIREKYKQYDALERFKLQPEGINNEKQCKAGAIMKGMLQPTGCPHFGKKCTPEHPLGAPMVSTEGACSAYYRYKFKSAI